MMKNKVIIILIAILVCCILMMEYTVNSLRIHDIEGGITNPVICMKLGCYDIVFGVVCYAIGKLINEKKIKLVFAAKFLGLWNFCGGLIIEIVTLVRLIIN